MSTRIMVWQCQPAEGPWYGRRPLRAAPAASGCPATPAGSGPAATRGRRPGSGMRPYAGPQTPARGVPGAGCVPTRRGPTPRAGSLRVCILQHVGGGLSGGGLWRAVVWRWVYAAAGPRWAPAAGRGPMSALLAWPLYTSRPCLGSMCRARYTAFGLARAQNCRGEEDALYADTVCVCV
jgi:hypothetical protein